jgi:hypothetical protein
VRPIVTMWIFLAGRSSVGRIAKDSWVVVDRLCNRESSYPADRPVNGPQGPQGDLGGLGCQM